MENTNSIVRTKTTHGNINEKSKMYYQIHFMTFEKYIDKSEFIYPNHKFELYPYKWYDLRWIYQKPSYWLLLKLFRKNLTKINTKNHKRTSIILLIIEILSFIMSSVLFIKVII